MIQTLETLETQLNDFDASRRREAIEALMARVDGGEVSLPEPRQIVNMHGHTFFSFNGYGYSPSYFAWKARRKGLLAAAAVDFDVLDATDEFLSASQRVGLRAAAGFETRVFLPEFATREINSPGEPGIAYHVGLGFTSSAIPDAVEFAGLKATAQQRSERMLERINAFLAPVILDYARDVLPLTPKGNATERHVCMAYDAKAREVFTDEDALAAYWSGKLGMDQAGVRAALADPPVFQGHIRAKTMKAGGAGYVRPEGPDFPRLDAVNKMILNAGGLPVMAWLDGLSVGEQALDELLDVMTATGAAAVNIIPDRNWNIKDAGTKRKKVEQFDLFIDAAGTRGLPVIVGTEINAYGQRFVDDFDAPEMARHRTVFLEGAMILYGHTMLQAAQGMGYLSEWAVNTLPDRPDRNRFFAAVGHQLDPRATDCLGGIDAAMDSDAVLRALR